MILRRPKEEEFAKLRQIHAQQEGAFEFPDFNKLFTLYVVEHEGELIGFGAVQQLFEAIMFLDKSKPVADRVEAIGLMQEQAEAECDGQIHAFVQDDTFANFLKRRLGYKSTKGKALVKVYDKSKSNA